ncbi:arginase family protein [Mesorhizobium sp. UC22_110]|uniref:arginase family protein n=1 Tax=Mesorhizobium sp. UC22_110 TaxID=3374552 RepID=UPI003756F70E
MLGPLNRAHSMRDINLIRAPFNLGLRPLRPGHEPGTWRAPQALTEAGLVEALVPARIIDLQRPSYSTEPQPDTKLRNGPAIRSFNLRLADLVADTIGRGAFPLVIGGDCTILLGALAGARCSGPLSLVHVDGHSDFRHPAMTTTICRLARPPAWIWRLRRGAAKHCSPTGRA